MRVGALATLKANRQLGVPPEAAAAAVPVPTGSARENRVRGSGRPEGCTQVLNHDVTTWSGRSR